MKRGAPRSPKGARDASAGAGYGATLTTMRSALENLASRVNLERLRRERAAAVDLRLDRVRAMLDALESPHEAYPIVQVVGTKGKGSTCAMLAGALTGSGCAVGVFTSPHLVDVRERLCIGGELISEQVFVDTLERVIDVERRLAKKYGELTYFEALTVMALVWFAEQAVDVAILECGLGGRLDATSAVTPAMTCVTAISFDHTHLLGTTLDAIAREKAGAFKPEIPVISVPQEKEARIALKAVADEVGAPISMLGRDYEFSQRFEASRRQGPHTCVCLSTERSSFEHIPVPLMGEHQALNCGLALAAWDVLRGAGFNLHEPEAIEGLKRTRVDGRMELVREQPRVVLDGAHNVASLRALVRSIGSFLPNDSMVMVFGCSDDKDVDGLLREVALGADKVIFTKARSSARGVAPEELQQRFGTVSGRMAQTAATLTEAMDLALRAVGRDDLICVAGSFYLVGDAKRLLRDKD